MNKLLVLLPLLLAGCASPGGDSSFVTGKTPAAASLSGERSPGDYAEGVRAANERNDGRLLKGEWLGARPAVGPGADHQRP
ncbi:MAG: hypothetical protein ACO3ND_03025 [Opitutales bacterium]